MFVGLAADSPNRTPDLSTPEERNVPVIHHVHGVQLLWLIPEQFPGWLPLAWVEVTTCMGLGAKRVVVWYC